jgi:hypothetical protein
MLKHSLVVLAVAGLWLVDAVPAARAAERTCPAAFETLTIEQAVEIKLALGYPLTREELEAAIRGVDQNQDENVCSLDLPDTRVIPPFISNMLDNKARVP